MPKNREGEKTYSLRLTYLDNWEDNELYDHLESKKNISKELRRLALLGLRMGKLENLSDTIADKVVQRIKSDFQTPS